MVRLTGGDLKLLVRYLALSSIRDLKTKGLVSLHRETLGGGRSVWRPRIRFRTRPLVQCPFLVNDLGAGSYRGLCSLHPHHKPLVCRLSPLTREVDDPGSGAVTETWSTVPPVEGCPGMGRGEILPLGPPQGLAVPLAEEIEWMRFLIEKTPDCPDEASAWALLERWETFS